MVASPPQILESSTMEKTPEDVLRLIMESYTHDFKQSPANLLTVCGQWRDLLLATRNVWSRVHIHVSSFHTIPYIIGKTTKLQAEGLEAVPATAPLLAYLERTIPSEGGPGLPLDIVIKWHPMETYSKNPDPAFYLAPYRKNDVPSQAESFASFHSLIHSLANQLREFSPNGSDFKIDDFKIFDAHPGRKSVPEIGHEHLCELQTQELVTWMAGQRDIKDANYKINESVGNYASRWKSLLLDTTQISCEECDFFEVCDVDFGLLQDPKHKSLKTLESLVAHGTSFLASYKGQMDWKVKGVPMPSLRFIEVYKGSVFPLPQLDLVESLTLVDAVACTNIDWEECKSMKTIHVKMRAAAMAFKAPRSHSFPRLSTIVLEDSKALAGILTAMSASFNHSRPLDRLVLAEPSLQFVAQMLRKAPKLSIKTLSLSSRHLRGMWTDRPLWRWREFERETWDVEERDVVGAQKVIQEAEKRGIVVEAIDSQMVAILEKAKSFDDPSIDVRM